jgi:hypothetical protein
MSQSQPWPLSQKAVKQSGICSVCFATRQLHFKDGTIHQHGPRNKRCPGSDLPPIGSVPSIGHSSQDKPNSQNSPALVTQPLASITTLASTTAASDSSSPTIQPSTCHPTYTGPVIKHIPRSARQHIAAELSSVLHHINSNPDDVSNWSTLLEFGSTMLRAPPRAGRRHNLASLLNKRSMSSNLTDITSAVTDSQPTNKKASSDHSLASAIMSKIEDGNIRAAIRIITSGDTLAVNNMSTYQALCYRHAPSDSKPPSDLSKLPMFNSNPLKKM